MVAEELLCSEAPAGYYYWGLHPQTLRPSCLHVFAEQIPDPAGRLMTTEDPAPPSRGWHAASAHNSSATGCISLKNYLCIPLSLD